MALNRSLDENREFASPGKMKFLRISTFFIVVIFVARLGQLQLVEGNKYKLVSEAQAIKKIRIEPYRGNLFDRNHILIVHNEPSFSITLTPNEFNNATMPLLCSVLGLDSNDIKQTLNQYSNYSKFTPIKIYRDADFSVLSHLEEYRDRLPGIDIVTESKRLYEFDGNMAHVLGYTREITQSQLEKKPYYQPGDVIGQTGIEDTYEADLRGIDGIQYAAVNKYGQKVASFNNGKNDLPAKNGFDLNLGINIKLQELAEKLLEGKRGAVVALDPNNGDVMVLASKPDYDPRDFTGRVPAELYNKLNNDPAAPLMHRAIQAQYPPGSTWKMLVAMAALQEGIIDENTTFHCAGGFQFGGKFRKCDAVHGNLNVRSAIKYSCNAFFFQLILKVGLKNLEKYGKMFGFGNKTFIDIPNEKRGVLPTESWLRSTTGREGPFDGFLVNYGIGQGEILVTPVQMAVYAAAIGNGGTIYQPHIVKSIANNLTNKTEPIDIKSRSTGIKPEIIKLIKDAMSDVVNEDGTARAARLPDIEVCGKTGTAQNPHGKDHAWFICYAPKEHPQIALCVMVENAGFGGIIAAPIAHDILDAFFHPEKLKDYLPQDSTQNLITKK